MSVSTYFPLMMTMMSPNDNRDEMLQMTLPALLPVSKQVQGAVTAMTAHTITNQHSAEIQNLGRQHEAEIQKVAEELANEIICAVAYIIKERKISDKHLEDLPLVQKYNLRDRLTDQVFQKTFRQFLQVLSDDQRKKVQLANAGSDESLPANVEEEASA